MFVDTTCRFNAASVFRHPAGFKRLKETLQKTAASPSFIPTIQQMIMNRITSTELKTKIDTIVSLLLDIRSMFKNVFTSRKKQNQMLLNEKNKVFYNLGLQRMISFIIVVYVFNHYSVRKYLKITINISWSLIIKVLVLSDWVKKSFVSVTFIKEKKKL